MLVAEWMKTDCCAGNILSVPWGAEGLVWPRFQPGGQRLQCGWDRLERLDPQSPDLGNGGQ